ncbi:hypothetical protein COOONC_05723 [Cooperia oncophora]
MQQQEEPLQFPCREHPNEFRDEFFYYPQHGSSTGHAVNHVDYGLAWNNHRVPNTILPPHPAQAQFCEQMFHPYCLSDGSSNERNIGERQRLRFSREVQRMDEFLERSNGRQGKDVSQSSTNLSRPGAQSDGSLERSTTRSRPKRSLLARLRAKKEKESASKCSAENKGSEKKDKKTKKKKALNKSPSTSSKCSVNGAAEPKRAALLNVSMKDKTKKLVSL